MTNERINGRRLLSEIQQWKYEHPETLGRFGYVKFDPAVESMLNLNRLKMLEKRRVQRQRRYFKRVEKLLLEGF